MRPFGERNQLVIGAVGLGVTAAVVLGGLTLAKVRYDHYLRFALPFIGIVFVVTSALLAVGSALG